jgi:hypothetical protein
MKQLRIGIQTSHALDCNLHRAITRRGSVIDGGRRSMNKAAAASVKLTELIEELKSAII